MARPRPRVAAWCPGFREAWAAVGRAEKLPLGRRGRCERGQSLSECPCSPFGDSGLTQGLNLACVRQRLEVGDQCEPQAEMLRSGPRGWCLSVGGDRAVAGARAGAALPACARLYGVELALEAPGIGLCFESGSWCGGRGGLARRGRQLSSSRGHLTPRTASSPGHRGHLGMRGCTCVVSDAVGPSPHTADVPAGLVQHRGSPWGDPRAGRSGVGHRPGHGDPGGAACPSSSPWPRLGSGSGGDVAWGC